MVVTDRFHCIRHIVINGEYYLPEKGSYIFKPKSHIRTVTIKHIYRNGGRGESGMLHNYCSYTRDKSKIMIIRLCSYVIQSTRPPVSQQLLVWPQRVQIKISETRNILNVTSPRYMIVKSQRRCLTQWFVPNNSLHNQQLSWRWIRG